MKRAEPGLVRERPPAGATPDRLSDAIPGHPASRGAHASQVVGVLPGEGIGPEVVEAALTVVADVARAVGLDLDVRSLDAPPRGFDEVVEFCTSIFAAGGAMLCGPVGGRFVYELRARFDLYCKVVPIRPSPALTDVAIVRPERARDADLLIVRENVGGLYAGPFGRRDGGRVVYQECTYSTEQVERIATVAVRLARRRRRRLAVIVKTGGIPEVSALWRDQVEAATAGRGVALEVLEVDNACFQLVAEPGRFDVIVAPNLFGDVVADAATVLLGSRGMSYSANFGPEGRAVYQTGHGAAHDLAGSDRANPVAQILSAAMMLRESSGCGLAALRIEGAVERVLAAGWRTADIAAPRSRTVGTRELAERIAEEAARDVALRAEVS